MTTPAKRVADCKRRLDYLLDIKGTVLREQYDPVMTLAQTLDQNLQEPDIERLETSVEALEMLVNKSLTPGDIVRMTRSPQRATLYDILMNVFDDFVELGGSGGSDRDPSVLVAHARIVRDGTNAKYPVMIIGHIKGRGEDDYTRAGAAKPEGNDKVIEFGRIAEHEGIPLLLFGNTPGAMHFEERKPCASQQIADNISFLAEVRTPVVIINYGEGGSGGFEALGVGDYKLMLSRAWYSVISPESAAAIEHKTATPTQEQIDACATQLRLTSGDCLDAGVVDRVIVEPVLGIRSQDEAFFDRMRYELVRAVDEVVLHTKSPLLNLIRSRMHRKSYEEQEGTFDREISWALTDVQRNKLVRIRQKKYRQLARYYIDTRTQGQQYLDDVEQVKLFTLYYIDNFLRHNQRIKEIAISFGKEARAIGTWGKKKLSPYLPASGPKLSEQRKNELQRRSGNGTVVHEPNNDYVSPQANNLVQITCPNADARHFSLWAPELFKKDGVCDYCGHHFPMEHQWYMNKVFDKGSAKPLFEHIKSGNPIAYASLDQKLLQARQKTGQDSAVITFDASVKGINVVVAMPFKDFIGGTIGTAEAEKITLALERAKLQKKPFLFYSHFCGGIRIYEGAIGLQAMAKCTFAARDYMDDGGLLLTVFDHNSYAGPVASFLSCTPYKFGIKSSKVAFAGPKVIEASAKHKLPADYQSVENALKRGQILGIWSRTDFRDNLHRCLMTMGGSNLYYR